MPTIDTLTLTDSRNKLRLVVNEIVDLVNDDVLIKNTPVTGNINVEQAVTANNVVSNNLTVTNSTLRNVSANIINANTANVLTLTVRTLTVNAANINNVSSNTVRTTTLNAASATIPTLVSTNFTVNSVTGAAIVNSNTVIANTINVGTINISNTFNFSGNLIVTNINVAGNVITKNLVSNTIQASGLISMNGGATTTNLTISTDATNGNHAVRKSQMDGLLSSKANLNAPLFTGTVIFDGTAAANNLTAANAVLSKATISTTLNVGGTLTAQVGLVSLGDMTLRRGTSNSGYMFFGNGTHHFGYDGATTIVSSGLYVGGSVSVAGGGVYQGNGDVWMPWAGNFLSTVLNGKMGTWQPTIFGGITRIDGSVPRIEFLWPGVWRKDIRLQSSGEVQFVNVDHGSVTHSFYTNGDIWTNSMGNVRDLINTSISNGNDRVHRVGMGAYGEMATHNPWGGGDYWLPDGCVPVKFLTNPSGGISVVGYKRIYQHVPALGGWVPVTMM